MRKWILSSGLAAMVLSLACPGWGGEGSLRINYAEILVENFHVGVSYSMKQAVNLPLEVTNKFDLPITVRIGVAAPDQTMRKPGFEPIPDPGWISLEKSEVDINPGQTYKTDVRVLIPDRSEFLGKRYEAAISASVIGSQGMLPLVAMGVSGRLLFSVAPIREKVDMEQTDVDLNFEISQDKIILKNFPLGKKVNLVADSGVPVEIRNLDEKAKSIWLESIDPKTTVVSEAGYRPAAHPGLLTFGNPKFELGKNAVQSLHASLEIPDLPEYQGKKVYFVAAASTGSGQVVQGKRYLRVLVETAGKSDPAEKKENETVRK